VAVRALFFAIPNVTSVTVIMLLFFLLFGVILVSYYKGKLYHCEGEMSDIPGLLSKWDCLSAGGDWVNEVYTFDNVLYALISLFVMATTAGWAGVMMRCLQTTEIDYMPDPEQQASPVWISFFIIFIIVGSFFFLNLFVGVVISTFNSESDKIGGNDLLTDRQKEWIDLRLLVLRSNPSRKP
jgi:Ion transport protein